MAIRARFPLFAAIVASILLHAVFLWVTDPLGDRAPVALPATVSFSIEQDRNEATELGPAQDLADNVVARPVPPAIVSRRDPPPTSAFADERARPTSAAEPVRLPSRAALIEAIAATAQLRRAIPQFRTSHENAPASQFYLDALARELHRVGRLNYPQRAKRQNLTGRLTISLTIRHDGRLQDTRIVSSSGHEILDTAAANIVRLAAPFTPPPAEMIARSDAIEIIHSWHFTRKSS